MWRFLLGKFAFVALVSLFVVAFQTAGAAQKQLGKTLSEDSYHAARRVLEAAINAYGGRDALRSIENYSIKFSGEIAHRNQSRRADPPYDRTPTVGTLFVDLKNKRISHEVSRSNPGGFDSHTLFITDNSQAASLDLLTKTMSKINNPAFSSQRDRLRWLPHGIVLDALGRAIYARFLGVFNFNDRPHEVVTYSADDGQQLALYFDARTHLMSKFEIIAYDIIVNETAAETIFSDYRSIDGKFKIPAHRVLRRAGEVVEEINYSDVKLNQILADESFQIPAGYATEAAAPPNQSPVSKLAENVYVIRAAADGYNAMFVAFKNYIVVLETPINDLTSKEVIKRIRETVPDKPIKYVVVTHHHNDHSGGVREYVREGANLITTPGNRGFFTRMVADVFEPTFSRPLPLPRREFLEFIQNKRRVLTDGQQIIELYDIGPSPHAEEMVVAYLPKERIIFQGDLLNLPEDERLEGAANITTKHFAEWLDKSKLKVDKIVAVHGPAATPDQMRKALASSSILLQ